jgi:hypothetical protein
VIRLSPKARMGRRSLSPSDLGMLKCNIDLSEQRASMNRPTIARASQPLADPSRGLASNIRGREFLLHIRENLGAKFRI